MGDNTSNLTFEIEQFSASLDADLEQLEGEVHFAGYDEYWMTPDTTARQLQEWLNGLSMCHLKFRVMRFRVGANRKFPQSPVEEFPFVIADSGALDSDPEKIGWTALERPLGGEIITYSPVTATRFEREQWAVPTITTICSCGAGDIEHMFVLNVTTGPDDDAYGRFADPDDADERIVPGLFAVLECRTNFVLIVTSESVVRFRALFDGDENKITVHSGEVERDMRRYFTDYMDDSKPLDEDKARSDAHRWASELLSIMKDGVHPSKTTL